MHIDCSTEHIGYGIQADIRSTGNPRSETYLCPLTATMATPSGYEPGEGVPSPVRWRAAMSERLLPTSNVKVYEVLLVADGLPVGPPLKVEKQS